jgi:ribosomal protein L11 methyltransferase
MTLNSSKEDAIFTTLRISTPLSDYIELAVSVDRKHAHIVSELFEDQGAYSVTVTSTDDEACFDIADPVEPDWEKQTLTALFDSRHPASNINTLLFQCLGYHPQMVQTQLKDRDWERSWLESFEPMPVGNNLLICPSWCDAPDSDRTVLTIDPGMAFGTGSHETTFLCLEQLGKLDLKEKTVLDFGCGSGILGIAASKLGAADSIGIDIDDRAVTASRENAEINGVGNTFQAMSNDDFLSTFPNYTCDLVIANILANTLIELSLQIKNLVVDGGMILLSGILVSQVDKILEHYGEDFNIEIQQKNDWVLVIGKSPDMFDSETVNQLKSQ